MEENPIHNEDLFDELPPANEISADEQAMSDAGLTHPSDLELEKIIQETLREDWTEAPAEPRPTPEVFLDDEFRETFGEGEILDQIFSDRPMADPPAPTEEPAPPEDEAPGVPEEKGRPRKKSGYGLLGIPHIASTAVWLLIILAVGITLGRMLWLCASDVLAFGREPKSVSITIEENDTLDDLAQKLKDAELIRYPELFKLYAGLSNAVEDLRPGTYHLNSSDDLVDGEMIVYDYMALVTALSPHSSGLEVVEDLRIPEGYTCQQIFKLLEEKGVCTVAELEKYAASGELKDYWFLEGVTRGDRYCLEGYLFPDTYDFYKNDDPQRVLEKMLRAFDASFTDVMRDKLSRLEGVTIRDVVIIASMIEKESANDIESFTVSSVIYNRLNNQDQYPYLNIDATIVYALGGKSQLTDEDLKLDSPYNTYTNKGLPPGPISSPSQNSIAAAMDPEDTDYYFYAYDPATQAHHFSSTYQEHQDFLASLKEAE